ncbi:hypothetical protein BX070DRAFT_222154 [Coemansia spiralis]|nr:hypothetical protein BX070DRAFT_222154 [Coemansia spiralis]
MLSTNSKRRTPKFTITATPDLHTHGHEDIRRPGWKKRNPKILFETLMTPGSDLLAGSEIETRVSSDGDSDTIGSDNGSLTPSCIFDQPLSACTSSTHVDELEYLTPRPLHASSWFGLLKQRLEKRHGEENVPYLTLFILRAFKVPSSLKLHYVLYPRVISVLGGISMVAPGVAFIILEKLIADDLDFHSPVFMQVLVQGLTALMLELFTSRWGLFVRSEPLRVLPMLPLVAIYTLGVLLSQSAHKVNSVHGTYQTIQTGLPFVVALIMASSSSSTTLTAKLKRAAANVAGFAIGDAQQPNMLLLPRHEPDIFGGGHRESKISRLVGSESGRWVAAPLSILVAAAIWSPSYAMVGATKMADGSDITFIPASLSIAYGLLSLSLSLGSLLAHALLLVGINGYISRCPGLSTAAFLRHFAPLCMMSLLVVWPMVEKPLEVLPELNTRALFSCIGVACLGALALIAKTAMLRSEVGDGAFGVAVVSQAKPLVCLAIGWWAYGYAYIQRQSVALLLASLVMAIWVIQRMSTAQPMQRPIISLRSYRSPRLGASSVKS